MSQEFRLRSHGAIWSMVLFNLEVFHFQQAALTPLQYCCYFFCLFVFCFRFWEGFDDDDDDADGADVKAAYSESLARLVMQPVLGR